MKLILLKLANIVGGGVFIRLVNSGLRKITGLTHCVQYMLEWRGGLTANWFDHQLDLHCLWPKTGNPLWLERGVFSAMAMKTGARVLELCCGDGFYSNYFYANRAVSVLAIDVDKKAIIAANKRKLRGNLNYMFGDIVLRMPDGKFDNIVWDSALEYFSESEIHVVMDNIRMRLAEGGVLSGYVIIQDVVNEGQKYAFKSKADLLRFVQPYFKNVRTFETIYEGRHNLYFYAGQEAVPFDADWVA